MSELSLKTGLLLASTILLPLAASAQEDPTPPGLEAEEAAPGTPEGAAALRATLEAYLTEIPFETGILDVTPAPSGQRIVISPADFLSGLVGRPIRFERLSLLVSERDDGNWNVFSDDPIDAAASFEFDGAAHEEEYRQDWQVFKGVFSPELGTFLNVEAHSGPTTQVSRDDVSTTVVGFVGSLLELSAEPAAGGGANAEFRQTYDSYAQSIAVEIPLDEDGEAFGFSFDLALADMETRGSIEAMRSRAMLDFYALLLSHAEALTQDAKATLAGPAGEEIKDGLRSALPLWGEIEMDADATDFTVATLYGDLTVAEVTQTVRMSGIDTRAFFETELIMSGISARSPFMPDWAAPLSPSSVEFGVSVSDVDLAAPVELALREIDFASDDLLSQDAIARLVEAFGAERIVARIEPSRIEAEMFEITLEGDMTLAESVPEARLSIEMRGLDETIAALQEAAADLPELHEAVGMLQIAKGFSQPGDEGQAIWLVETSGDGSVSLNGAMIKGPDEAPDMDGSPAEDL